MKKLNIGIILISLLFLIPFSGAIVDIESLQFNSVVNFPEIPNSINDMVFNSAGTKLILVEDNAGVSGLYEYNLSNFNLSSVVFNRYINASVYDSSNRTFRINWNNNGNQFYERNSEDSIIVFNVSPTYNIKNLGLNYNISYNNVSFTFRFNGANMYALTSDLLEQYSLSLFDLRTLNPVAVIDLSLDYSGDGRDLLISDDGTELYILSSQNVGNEQLTKYTLSTPFSILSGSLTQQLDLIDVSGCSGGNVCTLAYNDDQTLWFIGSGDNIYIYTSEGETITTTPSSAGNFTQIISNTINNFVSVFPDSSGLSLAQRLSYAILIMFLISIVILIAVYYAGGQVNSVIWGLLILINLGLFIFFVSISYIPIVIVIGMLLIGVAISYFKFRGSG